MRLATGLLMISIGFIVVGCANRTPIVREVDTVDPSRCQFLGLIKGSSLTGGEGSRLGLANAKSEALMQAQLFKATDVIWVESESQPDGSRVTGRSYVCK
jgi:hypothetical protein